jgi:trimeric autotransporter adhesin
MAVQIVRNQLIDLVINADKLDNGAVSYGKIASADIETSLTGGANKLASASAIKAYVDAQTPDSFSGGDGIAIDTTGDPDVISVDLETTNAGLHFVNSKLDAKIKVNSGLDKNADGLFVPIANGVFYDNGALGVQLDGTTLAKGAGGIKVNTGGISTAQLQDNAVTTAKIGSLQVTEGRLANLSVAEGKIQNGAVTADKVGFGTQLEAFSTDGSTTSFDLSATINQAFGIVMVHRNGLMLEQVGPTDTPSGVDQFKLELTTGAGGVSKVIFGAAPAASDSVTIFYIA